jgi:hypothetical protein
VARRVLDDDGRIIRNQMGMVRFRDQDEERRKRYFCECDRILEAYREEGLDPPDSFVVKMLYLTVETDRSFESFILGRQVLDPDWKTLREVCAAMFFEAYIRAKEDGAWPVEN